MCSEPRRCVRAHAPGVIEMGNECSIHLAASTASGGGPAFRRSGGRFDIQLCDSASNQSDLGIIAPRRSFVVIGRTRRAPGRPTRPRDCPKATDDPGRGKLSPFVYNPGWAWQR